MYGDIIVNVANQVRPYEVQPGSADAMTDRWSQKLVDGFQAGKGMNRRQMRANFDAILADFEYSAANFKKILPRDYAKMLQAIAQREGQGMGRDEAELEACYAVTGGAR